MGTGWLKVYVLVSAWEVEFCERADMTQVAQDGTVTLMFVKVTNRCMSV
jgi:hypothetical protein